MLQSWETLGLKVAAGTVAGGFAYLAPMFGPLMQAFRDQQHLDTHWHADETGWKVFEFVEGKKTNRWYLWVYRSPSVIYFNMEPSRAAAVPEAHFKGLNEGIIICDRYSAYKKMARTLGFLLAFCWAHVRRDFLTHGFLKHSPQAQCHWRELDASLFQHPRFYLDVPHAQQVERAADIVLFAHTLRGMTLDLRSDTGWCFRPLIQGYKAADHQAHDNCAARGCRLIDIDKCQIM